MLLRHCARRFAASKLGVVTSLSLSLLASSVFAAEKVLPGTQPLTIKQPLDEVMVAGIDKFALREIAASPARREQLWKLDGANATDWDKTIAARRAKFAEYIGAVDTRVTATEPHKHVIEFLDGVQRAHLVGSIEPVSMVGPIDGATIHAVRWNVLDGVTAEGLLLNPSSGVLKGHVVVLPDADWTPEMFCGLADGVAPQAQLPKRLVAEGFGVIIPMLISRSDEHSGSPYVRYTNQTHREFIYRQAFEMGRHVIGYEVQKVLAAVDILTQGNERAKANLPVGVVGVGEGGLIAMYAAAVDPRISSTLVSGYFRQRDGVWAEPIYRNVWGLLTEFGDAEIAGMIAPRALTIEASGVTEIPGPPTPKAGRGAGAAPGKIETATLASVRLEHDRAKRFYDALKATDKLTLSASGEGDGPAGTPRALTAFAKALSVDSPFLKPVGASKPAPVLVPGVIAPNEPKAREKRQLDEMQRHVQNLLRLSNKVRDKQWAKADRSTPEKWAATVEPVRDWVYDELIGRLPQSTMPLNPRTRLIESADWLKGHEGAFDTYEVVLDVYEDVIASGMLLLPKDLKPNEKRPVVVCQHGLEGTPMDTISGPGSSGYPPYKAFSAELCKRGFIVYAPQNPYRGKDLFRTLQRKSNVMKRSLFSYIIPQHDRTLEWLASLPFVDKDRLAFYGLSYGGKTAVRVPPMLPPRNGKAGYCLSICSADYNEWVKKNTSNEDGYSYVFTGEYEIFEWNMGHVANYAELSYLMTPRPFMVERGHDDGVAPDEWVAWEFAKVKRHYDKIGLGDNAEIEFFIGPHTINGQGTYRFLHKHLKWPEKK